MAARKRAGVRPAKAVAAPQPSDAEVARLERLIALMNDHGLTELELGPDGRSVRMSKTGPATYAVGAPLAAPAGNPAAAPAAGAPAKAAKSAGDPFLSPMVGTFYRAASPEAKAFVMEGDSVKADSTLCIIEAMKVMNEIKAEKPGKVLQILVENGEAVEYGQPLFLIQR
ncbi:MAG TPA: acetyl-CoA carboxylase biotin carboxyl carrier protein [Planctomycetota bacterium]|jgi:acetyl-CoA carboxylase biotin carboxyl carrier protein|nr:acetyl-CoA carboxylase biotin carboxyl carrier protein [Planctomycetota bacterium]